MANILHNVKSVALACRNVSEVTEAELQTTEGTFPCVNVYIPVAFTSGRPLRTERISICQPKSDRLVFFRMPVEPEVWDFSSHVTPMVNRFLDNVNAMSCGLHTELRPDKTLELQFQCRLPNSPDEIRELVSGFITLALDTESNLYNALHGKWN